MYYRHLCQPASPPYAAAGARRAIQQSVSQSAWDERLQKELISSRMFLFVNLIRDSKLSSNETSGAFAIELASIGGSDY